MPTTKTESLVLVSKQNGFVIIPAATPLTRLNYFDGKFLRASDLNAEQNYLRQLVAQSNQAGGSGVAHGFDLTLAGGDTLEIGPGLAIDPSGRVLLLPQGATLGVQELIDKSRDLQRLFGSASVLRAGSFERCELDEGPLIGTTAASNLYLIVISPAEALCGEEDVYGKLCEEACATSTDRPFAVEGLTVRAIPLVLQTPLPSPKVVALTQAHLRSRVAAAYFEDERRRVASLISAFGLQQETWCLGSDAAGGSGVPLGVIARAGSTTVFLDPWIARRERIDAPAKRYWQWRMMMRPWDVFLAQVLQFQCQLHDLFRKTPVPGDVDPCGGAGGAIREAAEMLGELKEFYQSTTERFTALKVNLDEAITFRGGLSRFTALTDKLGKVSQDLIALPQDRLLINGGIIELPSAGYLPVVPGGNLTVNQQVRRLMGEGVDLRFCVVRPDYVAHALEAAQHMERISLIEGLEDPRNKPQVDILVPDGEVIEVEPVTRGAFEASVQFLPDAVGDLIWTIANLELTPALERALNGIRERAVTLTFNGAARHETSKAGGHSFYAAMLLDDSFMQTLISFFLQPQTGGTITLDTTKATSKKTEAKASAPDGAADVSSRRLFSLLKTASAKRRARVADSASAEGQPQAAAVAGVPLFPEALAAPVGQPMLPAGLWLAVSCDKDLPEARANDTLLINARAVIGTQFSLGTSISAYVDIRMNIDAFVEAAGTRADGGGFIRCRASVFGSIITGLQSNKRSDARVVNLDVEINWAPLAGGSGNRIDVKIAEPGERTGVTFTGTAGGPEQRIEGMVISGPDNEFRFGLRPNADVLKIDDARHERALAALSVIGSALNSPSFVASSSTQLFPAPPKPTEELLVRGRKDWVLFHRRRNKRCSADLPPPVAVADRRFALWMGVAANANAVTVIAQALKNGTPISPDLVFFRRVDVVEFNPGLATMISRPEDLLADWKLTDPGETIVHTVIASPNANDGETVAQGRLSRVEQAIATVSKGEGETSQVHDSVHPDLAVPGVDGVIAVITLRTQVATVCHPVYRAANKLAFSQAVAAIQQGSILDAITRFKLELLGTVVFKAGTSEVSVPATLEEVTTRWQATGGGEPGAMAVVSHEGTQAVELDQASAIQRAIGPAIETPVHVETPIVLPAPPIACPVFSLMVERAVDVQRRTALLVFATVDDAQHFPDSQRRLTQITFTNNVPDGTSLDVALRTANITGQVGGVTIASIAATEPGMAIRLTAVVGAVKKVGGQIPGAALSQQVTQLSVEDTTTLANNRIPLTNINEVIFIEEVAG